MNTSTELKHNGRIAPRVLERIRAMMDELTKSQRILAAYLVQKPEKVGFLPISDLAKASGVSVATVVRFCNKLGYSGYVELGREVQNSIQNELSILDRFNLSQGAAKFSVDKNASSFERILSIEIENLNQLVKSINKSDFFQCLKWMSEADHVVIIGTMASESLASYFGYAATKVLPSVRVITSMGGFYSDFLKGLGDRSLVFLIAYPRYPNATLQLGRLTKKQGCRIISLTDNHQSPLIQIADLAFLISISVTSIVDAYAAPITFINALITEYAERYSDNVKDTLISFEKFTTGLAVWHQQGK